MESSTSQKEDFTYSSSSYSKKNLQSLNLHARRDVENPPQKGKTPAFPATSTVSFESRRRSEKTAEFQFFHPTISQGEEEIFEEAHGDVFIVEDEAGGQAEVRMTGEVEESEDDEDFEDFGAFDDFDDFEEVQNEDEEESIFLGPEGVKGRFSEEAGVSMEAACVEDDDEVRDGLCIVYEGTYTIDEDDEMKHEAGNQEGSYVIEDVTTVAADGGNSDEDRNSEKLCKN